MAAQGTARSSVCGRRMLSPGSARDSSGVHGYGAFGHGGTSVLAWCQLASTSAILPAVVLWNVWLRLQQRFGGSGGSGSAVYAPWLQAAAPTAVAAALYMIVAVGRCSGFGFVRQLWRCGGGGSLAADSGSGGCWTKAII